MNPYMEELVLHPSGKGLFEFTHDLVEVVERSGVTTGLATVFLCHTSASLVIQENADPSARRDLESVLDRLVPENDPIYTHTAEGSDDMPAHIKAALTHTSEQIPISGGRLVLGTWQGIYLWEHRRCPGKRRLIIHVEGCR